MVERHLIVDRLKFSYEGIFNVAEIYNIISSYFYENSWNSFEKLNQEMITSTGKQIIYILCPWKNVSDYYKIQINIKIIFTDIKDVEIEIENKNLKVNQGVMRMTIDGFLFSDRKNAWSFDPKEKKSVLYWLFALIGEKYFFRNHFEKFEIWVKTDVDNVINRIKNYLNVYKYTHQM